MEVAAWFGCAIAGCCRIACSCVIKYPMNFSPARYWSYFYFRYPKPLAEGLNSI